MELYNIEYLHALYSAIMAPVLFLFGTMNGMAFVIRLNFWRLWKIESAMFFYLVMRDEKRSQEILDEVLDNLSEGLDED